MSQKNTPSKNQQAFQTNNILVTSLGAMQPTHLPNIAPAPQGGAQAAMGQPGHLQQPMAPSTPQSQPGGQVMTSLASTMPQVGQPALPQGPFQLFQQPYGGATAGTPQYVQPFAASYNQQGQLVLQQQPSFTLPPGMQVAQQQPGQQQYILTPASSQKPGQPTQMIASPAPAATPSGKAITPQSLPQTPVGQNQQPAAGTTPTQTQPIMLQPGMYVSPQPGQPQAFLQNGQLIFRATAPQDPSQQVVFSPSGQISQQGQMQIQQPQMSLSANMQPVVTMSSASSVRPSSNGLPMQPAPPGKTPISRNLAPLLPTSTIATRPTTYMAPNLPPNQSSPKSKPKMSPRGSGAPIGRPPGPAKSSLNALKTPTTTTSVSASPVLGPPVLQSSQGNTLPPPAQNVVYSQPPKLQPMLPPPTTSNDSTKTSTAVTMSNDKTVGNKKEEDQNNVDNKKQFENGFTTKAPQAVVKPNVLTHIIDGHLIMESSEPFPVDREDKGNALRNRRKSEKEKKNEPGSVPERKRGPGRPPGSTRQNIEQQRLNGGDKGKSDLPSAPKQPKLDDGENLLKPQQQQQPVVQQSQQQQQQQPTNNTSSALAGVPASMLKDNPLKWSVQQVCDFIKSLSGCSEYVDDFIMQEIDGQALMLLKADHLMSAMQIKLGPALKICSAVDALRDEVKQN